ncbi:MAG: hypothetical protein ACI4S2_05925 [Lachnospiraceae bacterium]
MIVSKREEIQELNHTVKSNMDKIKDYEALVEYVNSQEYIDLCNSEITDNEKEAGLELQACPFCDEVNLWTYWEGGRDRLDADILVVGQDWGTIPGKTKFIECLEETKRIGKQFSYKDMMGEEKYPTDDNLRAIFKTIGYNSVDSDYLTIDKEAKNVFFTNFVMGYRKGNASKGYRKAWTDASKEPFLNLVKIIKPKVIVCLSQTVYNSMREMAGLPTIKEGYVKYVIEFDGTDNNCKLRYDTDLYIATIPVCHPGAQGILNRCKAYDNDEYKDDGSKIVNSKKGVKLQAKEWKKVIQIVDSKRMDGITSLCPTGC